MVKLRRDKSQKKRGEKRLFDKFKNFKQDVLTLPNLLTSIRILLVPVVIILLWLGTPMMRFLSWVFYTVASVTDFFDGYLARKYGTISITGKLLDPLADKFIVNLTLVLLAAMGEISPWPVIIILAREFYIFGIRSLALEHALVVAAGRSGKIKTVLQMFSLPFFMINQATLLEITGIEWDPSGVGNFLVWSSIFFSVVSAFNYTREVKKRVFEEK
ncbi:CDP-diacylglycerol--glycerol-3-phosphate 3-phosphatidyltransferase [bacterium]|nr:CDP-diacylglycerol--glycerol-3-phosphate 3-phosphatidyltransferase [bacterium]MBR6245485.1 CDP-diacylglycerol--glycerol-3-phosphate 3-phosphatidyltransferase [bacterium]